MSFTKHTLARGLSLGLWALALSAAALVPAQAQETLPPLFQSAVTPEAAGATPLSATQRERLDALAAAPDTDVVLFGLIDPIAIRQARGFELDLGAVAGPGGAVRLALGNMDVTEVSASEFHLSSPDLLGTTGTVIVSGGDVLGTIEHEGALYRLRPLGDGQTVLLRVDRSGWRDHPEGFFQDIRPSAPADGGTSAPRSEADTSTIDVLIAFTPAAIEQAGGEKAALLLAKQAMLGANKILETSRIEGLQYRLVGAGRVGYRESGNIVVDRKRLYERGDGHLEALHPARDAAAADVVVLFMHTGGQVCGVAAGIGVDHEKAFALVSPECVDYHSFAHEIGHLHGAQHNPEAPVGEPVYPYAYGNCPAGKGWRTAMAYNSNNCRQRLGVFSTPALALKGVPLGDRATRHNARAMVESFPRVARFRDSATRASADVGPAAFETLSVFDAAAPVPVVVGGSQPGGSGGSTFGDATADRPSGATNLNDMGLFD